MVLQCALVFAPDVHFYHHLGGHFEHLVGPFRSVRKSVSLVTAVFNNASVLMLMVVLLTYQVFHHRLLSHLPFFYEFWMALCACLSFHHASR